MRASDDKEKESRQVENNYNSDKQNESQHTDRELEREEEEAAYTSVIVKRSDEALRHPDDILENAIHEGLEQLKRPSLSLFLSSMAGGLILGFTAMSVAVIETQAFMEVQQDASRIAVGLIYPLGFVLCIMSGTQLFTEHTATAVYPILDRKSNVRELMRLWIIVILGNLVGAAVSAGVLTMADNVIGAKTGYVNIGHHLISYQGMSLFISAMLAGWLMALGAWLVMATQPTLSQMASIYIVTFIIGIGGLHHSIAGSVEIFVAYMISDNFSLWQVTRFIAVAILGNLVGGSIFVAILNYGHIRETQKS